jgi:hypothetical protein
MQWDGQRRFPVEYDPTGEEKPRVYMYIRKKFVLLEGAIVGVPPEYSLPIGLPGTTSPYCRIRHSETLLLVYEVTSRRSFDAVKGLHDNFYKEREQDRAHGCCRGLCLEDCQQRPEFQGIKFVIANKIDRDEKEWEVSAQEGRDFAAHISALFIEMSAKTQECCNSQVWLDIVSCILWQRQRIGEVPS